MYPPTIAELTPDAHAYEMADSGEVLTFGQLDAQSNQVAHLLGYVLVGFLGYWLLVRRMPVQRAIAFGIAVAAPLAGAAMAVRFDYPVPTRYGASLLALVLFLLAVRRRPAWLSWVLIGLTTSLVFVTWEGTDSYLFMVG